MFTLVFVSIASVADRAISCFRSFLGDENVLKKDRYCIEIACLLNKQRGLQHAFVKLNPPESLEFIGLVRIDTRSEFLSMLFGV